MTETTVRRICGEEMLDIMHWLPAYAFRSSPPLADKAERHERLLRRDSFSHFALFENGQPVACASMAPMVQQVRGAPLSMGGILDVATHPAARRKGYARQLLSHVFRAIHEDGRSLSCLYPSTETFYERLGYVSFPQPRRVRITPSALVPLVKKELNGRVDLLLQSDAFDVSREYLRRVQQGTHGMALFEKEQRPTAERSSHWVALARSAGSLTGLMQYDLRGEGLGNFKLTVTSFYYDTSQAKYLLLSWIARHLDQANAVEIWLHSQELPETWLPGLQVVPQPVEITPMGRVIDVSGAGGMRTGPGRLAARIVDPFCPWNEGVWEFETVGGVLQVAPGGQASCELTIHALSALVYGTHDPGDFTIRGWGNPTREIQRTMRGMFSRLMPHLHEHF
jgi:predicted acetyltransferase